MTKQDLITISAFACVTPCATLVYSTPLLLFINIKFPSSSLFLIFELSLFSLLCSLLPFSLQSPCDMHFCPPPPLLLHHQMNLHFPSWACQSSMINSSDGAAMSLPHHQAAAPALPLDQSCLPEESASATRAHNSNSSSSNSHHSSPTFSNPIPEFMESVIDLVSL